MQMWHKAAATGTLLFGSLLAQQQQQQQQAKWQLPIRGAAEYRRTATARSCVAESPAKALSLAVTNAVPERYLPKVPPAALLCQGELDREQLAIADAPRDLRDVMRAVAFDLHGRSVLKFARLVPFGDLQISSSGMRVDADGAQAMSFTVTSSSPDSLPGDEVGMRKTKLLPLCPVSVAGTLQVQRTVDVALGLVNSCRSELNLVFAEAPKLYRRINLVEDWTIAAVHQNQDAWFRSQVSVAVRRAAGWLLRAIEGASASYLKDKEEQPERSFGSGRLALACQTLFHADVAASDPILERAFAELMRRKLFDTYAISTALMALSARYAPPRETELIHDGTLQERSHRQVPATDRTIATGWLSQLLHNVDRRTDPDRTLRFNYTAASRFDNSVQQYGLLGLDAAQLCDIGLPKFAWQAAAKQLLDVQGDSNGRSHALVLATHKDLAAGKVARKVRCPTRGFSYQDGSEPAYGSMTAAGTSGLLLARAGMLMDAQTTDLGAMDAAIEAGFAWIAEEFTTRANPGFVGRSQSHWYYWLYSLERVCELAGVAQIDGRDWYFEGAMQLLAHQESDGSFRSDDSLRIEATCFAVLFLKKATAAVRTGR
jgi:hypothetical protein